jgi:hypothetical protein
MARSARSVGLVILGVYLVLSLGVYLVLSGLMTLTGFGFPASGVIMGLLALLAGILLLLGR